MSFPVPMEDPVSKREQFLAELGAHLRDLPHLTRAGLDQLRAWLRHPDARNLADSHPNLAELHADLLDQLCRRLIHDHGCDQDHFRAAGDMIERDIDLPDTIEGIENAQ